ncbi:hypothetical protein ITJ43_14300 [Microbacterium sp. VKM Ac-2870]|uniref:hypothetical protein n=1 Tax=Microbacterium sp. VKM Ac-2870 TaxID=2783825 RepID=UPI00188A39A4|nr:hypothetical protein [Microbacterium sp. VKM Ac-2870]MBF4563302.1 hypothetical protein [Microbacterium sp. VKM Ac-2870]
MLSAAVIGLTGALALTGCETGAGYGAAALSQTSKGDIRLAICAPTEATKLSFSVRDLAVSKDWTTVVEYQGRHNFTSGDTFEIGAPISGMQITQKTKIPISSGQEYTLLIDGNPERTIYWRAIGWDTAGSDWVQVNHSANLPSLTPQACPTD